MVQVRVDRAQVEVLPPEAHQAVALEVAVVEGVGNFDIQLKQTT